MTEAIDVIKKFCSKKKIDFLEINHVSLVDNNATIKIFNNCIFYKVFYKNRYTKVRYDDYIIDILEKLESIINENMEDLQECNICCEDQICFIECVECKKKTCAICIEQDRKKKYIKVISQELSLKYKHKEIDDISIIREYNKIVEKMPIQCPFCRCKMKKL